MVYWDEKCHFADFKHFFFSFKSPEEPQSFQKNLHKFSTNCYAVDPLETKYFLRFPTFYLTTLLYLPTRTLEIEDSLVRTMSLSMY